MADPQIRAGHRRADADRPPHLINRRRIVVRLHWLASYIGCDALASRIHGVADLIQRR